MSTKKTNTTPTAKSPTAARKRAPKGSKTPAPRTIEAEVPGQGAKLSALDAAAKVLGETGTPMNCQALIETMAAQGYWTSPAGQTPAATLYASLAKEIASKGTDSRFVKVERGQFALRAGA